MTLFDGILLAFLLICAVSVSVTRNLLASVIIFMGFSLIMSVIWLTLEAPDLAITEAAVGAGVTGLLFFATLKKIHAIKAENGKPDSGAPEEDGNRDEK